MDSLELSAALDSARANAKYWQDLAAVNAEQIAALREEGEKLVKLGLRTAGSLAAREADLEAARKELGEAVGLLREAHAMLVDLWVLAGPALPDDDMHKSVDKTVSGLAVWLSDYDRRHPAREDHG